MCTLQTAFPNGNILHNYMQYQNSETDISFYLHSVVVCVCVCVCVCVHARARVCSSMQFYHSQFMGSPPQTEYRTVQASEGSFFVVLFCRRRPL